MKKILLLVSLIGFLLTSCGGGTSTATTSSAVETTLQQATLKGVQGLCDMCKSTIEKAALSVPNIKTAVWNGTTKELKLESAETLNLAAISKAVAAVGYDTEMDKGDDNVYVNLPSCCQYR